jgi:hypothetical protein
LPGYTQAPVPSQSVAPHATKANGHVALQQWVPVPVVPQWFVVHWLFAVHTDPGPTRSETQTPPVQACVAVLQTVPQAPQWLLSVWRFVQIGPLEPEHVVWPVEQETPQTPFAQT